MTAGRPTDYTRELADLICERMSRGPSLRSICRQDDIPIDESTVRHWAIQDIDGFAARYAKAREAQMDAWADEILEVSDDDGGDTIGGEDGKTFPNSANIQRSRLRVDTRKWLMSKIAPKRYAEKVQAEHSGSVNITISSDDGKL